MRNEASCEADSEGCTSFEEANALAQLPYSGVHTLTLKREPTNTATTSAAALNDSAICRGETCYLRASGKVSIYAVPSPGQQFTGWSCSAQGAQAALSNLTKDTECVAHFAALDLASAQ